MSILDIEEETREFDKLLQSGFFESRKDEYRRLFPDEFLKEDGYDDKLEGAAEEQEFLDIVNPGGDNPHPDHSGGVRIHA